MIAVTFFRDVSNPFGFADTWPAKARRLRRGEQAVSPEVEVTEEEYFQIIQDGEANARTTIDGQPKVEGQRTFRGTLQAQDDDGNNVTLHLEGRLGGPLTVADVTRGGRR